MSRRPLSSVSAVSAHASRKSKVYDHKKKAAAKHNLTAGALRNYKKAMKKEGFEAGDGKARRRRERGDKGGENKKGEKGEGEEEREERGKSIQKKGQKGSIHSLEKEKFDKRAKSDPYKKAKEKGEMAKEAARVAELEYQANLAERDRKIKARKERTKQMKRRTGRGQVVMKGVIEGMLDKIKGGK